jgi:Domain of unknown function (DUF6285)
VKQSLDDLGPKLEGESKYHAHFSSYLLGICERELRLAVEFNADEQGHLSPFLGADGWLDDLTAKLYANLRAGTYDERWDEVLDVVLAQTIDK